jgi:predicted nucleotide-binding protein
MTKSEELELGIYRFVDSCHEKWRACSLVDLLTALGQPDPEKAIATVIRLIDRGSLDHRKWWPIDAPANQGRFMVWSPRFAEFEDVSREEFFSRGQFQLAVAPEGHPYFEALAEKASVNNLPAASGGNVSKTLPGGASRVFVGHGRSPEWLELRDFLERRLDIACEEFNSECAAGISTVERLNTMLENSQFAFLIFTAEEERSDGTKHARDNVIHEAGLFAGRLGFRRAVILMEEGCEGFSNIHGLTHISFPTGRIRAAFEDVRSVLEREKII